MILVQLLLKLLNILLILEILKQPLTYPNLKSQQDIILLVHRLFKLLEKSIGEGTFGKVKLGTHQITNEKVNLNIHCFQVAIKILEKDRITDVADVERVAREIHILKLIRHPNIIQLYEIIETPKQLYLIMEYASGGELFDYIVANTRLEEIEAVKFF